MRSKGCRSLSSSDDIISLGCRSKPSDGSRGEEKERRAPPPRGSTDATSCTRLLKALTNTARALSPRAWAIQQPDLPRRQWAELRQNLAGAARASGPGWRPQSRFHAVHAGLWAAANDIALQVEEGTYKIARARHVVVCPSIGVLHESTISAAAGPTKVKSMFWQASNM